MQYFPLYRVIVVVMIVRNQNKRRLLFTHTSPAVMDSLDTSPVNYYMSHEKAYEIEKEKPKQAKEERRDPKHENEDSLEIPQDHSYNESGM